MQPARADSASAASYGLGFIRIGKGVGNLVGNLVGNRREGAIARLVERRLSGKDLPFTDSGWSAVPDPLLTVTLSRKCGSATFLESLWRTGAAGRRPWGAHEQQTFPDHGPGAILERGADSGLSLDSLRTLQQLTAQAQIDFRLWTGGHLIEPKEQNTQQSPGFGRSKARQFSHS